MRIVVEGCDNSGKTTFALRLAEDLKALYLKTHMKPDSLEYMYKWAACVYGLTTLYPAPLVFDRDHFISDQVYGPLIRGVAYTPDPRVIQRHLAGSTIVYCRPPDEYILHWGDREQMPGVKETALQLIQAYDKIMLEEIAPMPDVAFWLYDYSVDPYDVILASLK